jgi:lactate dehydrogenase-like 2-hydroxyacid dehydrogenase
MMGVALSGPTFFHGENMSVVHITQRPESVLNKKSNSICYHAVRESAAMGDSIIGHVPSVENTADIFTKVMPGGQKRNHLIHLLLHDFCD